MKSLDKVVILILAIILNTSIAAGLGYPWEVTADDSKEIKRLQQNVGYRGGRLRDGFSDNVAHTLLQALESPLPAVKVTALWITVKIAEEEVLPRETVEGWITIIGSKYLDEPPQVPNSEIRHLYLQSIERFSKRILWHVERRRQGTHDDLKEFFARALVRGGDDQEYYVDWSVNQLAEMGGSPIEKLLTARLNEVDVQSRVGIHLHIGIRKLEIRRELERLNRDEKIAYCRRSLEASASARQEAETKRMTHFWIRIRLDQWILKEAGRLGDHAANGFLIDVLKDESFHKEVRLIAQELLFERGVLEHPFEIVRPDLH